MFSASHPVKVKTHLDVRNPDGLLTIAILVLAAFVWTLFEQDKEIRSGFESRLKAIEGLQGPFARKLADEGPVRLSACSLLASTWTLGFGGKRCNSRRPNLMRSRHLSDSTMSCRARLAPMILTNGSIATFMCAFRNGGEDTGTSK